MGELHDHAEYELRRAGLFDADSDYGGMIGTAALQIIDTFADQGHSGYSADMVTDIVGKLLRFKPLTPLTGEPEEWIDRSEESGYPLWQNRRDPAVFSKDGGKTAYSVEIKKRDRHSK